jgi:hypothetical protein
MTYKATPEQWETIAEYAKDLNSGPACLLELRARVELLELGAGIRDAVAKELDRNYPAKPDSSLVERVHSCIVGEPECGHMQARAAIREVAAWMTSNPDIYFPPALVFAIEQETDR